MLLSRFSEIGAAHAAASCAALAFGLLVLLMRKGTALHRALGMTYAVSMLAVNATALTLYRLTGHFGPFHALALVSLAAIGFGVAAAVVRWRGWLVTHYRSMSYSYIGLLSAAATQILVRVPALRGHGVSGGIAIGLATTAVFLLVGRLVVRRLQAGMLATMSPD